MVSYLQLDYSQSMKRDLLPLIDKLAINGKTRTDVVRDKLYEYFQYTPSPRSDLQYKIDSLTEKREENRIHGKAIIFIVDEPFRLAFFTYIKDNYRDGMKRYRKVTKNILYEVFGIYQLLPQSDVVEKFGRIAPALFH